MIVASYPTTVPGGAKERLMVNPRHIDALQLASLFVVALALVPAAAHLFELPNKIGLPPEQYMTVQDIYRGWALFGIVIIGALLLTLTHTIAVRAHTAPCCCRWHAALCVAASLAVFFAFTYPMNVVTANWTVVPADFEAARRQWEYSHAVNAVLMLAAFVALASSVLASRPAHGPHGQLSGSAGRRPPTCSRWWR